MKIRLRSSAGQRGVILVFALLILVVLTIVGVAALSGSMMQERMAGNAHLQARAFEAASAGVASALTFRDANMPANQTCNSTTSSQWQTNWVPAPNLIGGATLRQRMYCVDYGADSAAGFAGFELFVLNRGEVLGDDGLPVATRDIEVRINTLISGMPGDGCAAFCFPAGDDIGIGDCAPSDPDFCGCAFERDGVGTIPRHDDPNQIIWNWSSGSLEVAGHPLEPTGHAPAFTGPANLMEAWKCHIAANHEGEDLADRLNQFKGGFGGGGDLGLPWSDPEATFTFVNELRNLATVFPGGSQWGRGGGSNTVGGGFNQITYVDGDATLAANAVGSGILVVEGALNWGGGTPQFDGLVIALGGVFNGGGGGNGGDEGGSIVITSLNPKPSEDGSDPVNAVFDPAVDIRMDFSGGGAAGFKFGCDALWALLEDRTLEGGVKGPLHGTPAAALWEPACDADGGFTPGGIRTGLASWRENIGWRSGEFFGND